MTSAQRMRRLRERARSCVAESTDLADVPDTGLLDALGIAYRKGTTQDMADIVIVLFERANARAVGGHRLTPTFIVTETESQ